MRVFAGGLPLVAFLFMCSLASIFIWNRRKQSLWQPSGASFLYPALMWGACVVIFTESLSVMHALSALALGVCWLAVTLVAAGALIIVLLRMRGTGELPIGNWAAILLRAVAAEKYTGIWFGSILITVLILLVTGVTALTAAPNNWDAMTYHLARVQHWIQNQSVDFYPTNNTRQLFDPPWAEYAILQFQLLTGGDSLANLVQWFGGLGSCIGASLIAGQLGANRAGQGLAMVLAATTPMAILQASSPQNDLVTSFWIVCCIYFALSIVRQPDVLHASALGTAFGLAMLTKGTAYIFAAPILLGLTLWLVTRLCGQRHLRGSLGHALGLVCVLAALMLALNGAQYLRNTVTFHSPLGPDGAAYANQTFMPSALACNAIRDISLEFGLPSATFNSTLDQGVTAFCGTLGMSVNDPRISWTASGGLPFRINPFNTYEGTAGNPIQSVLIVVALAIAFASRRLRRRREVAVYAVLLGVGYILFVSYLRWQPWGNRLLLPWFMAAAGVAGTALDRMPLWRVSFPLLELALLLLAAPFLLLNRNDPLIGSSTVFSTPHVAQYFVSNTGVEKSYRDAARFVNERGCLSVGFHSGVEGWEYPFWLLIGPKPFQAHIEQVLVSNPSARLANTPHYQRFQPCAIINVIDPAAPEPDTVVVNGTWYQSGWSDGLVAVYLPLTGQP